MRLALAIFVAVAFAGCRTWPAPLQPCDAPNAVRCLGSTVQVCGSDHRWRDDLPCDGIAHFAPDGGVYRVAGTCEPTDGGAACAP